MPKSKKLKASQKKSKLATVYDVNRNPLQVSAKEVNDYLAKGYKKECPPAQAADPLDTAEGRFSARRPSDK